MTGNFLPQPLAVIEKTLNFAKRGTFPPSTIKQRYGNESIEEMPHRHPDIREHPRIGLMESLLPNYVQRTTNEGLTTIEKMNRALRYDDLEGMLRLLQQYLLTIPMTVG